MGDEEKKKAKSDEVGSPDASKEAFRETTPPEDKTEVLEFEFNDDGEEDLKKTLKKFRADLKICKKRKLRA